MSQDAPTAPLVVGLHTPKCAGLTLLRHVQSHLPSDLIYQCTGLQDNFAQDRPEFLQLFHRDRLRVLFGHHLHEQMFRNIRRPTFLFVGLREPIERMRSQLNYNQQLYEYLGKDFDASSFLKDAKNPVCAFILSRFPRTAGHNGSPAERAMRVLECFHFVYFPDTFSQLCATVTSMLELPPVSNKENVAQSHQAYQIDEENFREDTALYDEAYARWGPHSLSRGSPRADDNVSALCNLPADLNTLRHFMYRLTYDEYRDWGILDDVISARTQQIEEITAELSVYKSFLEARQ